MNKKSLFLLFIFVLSSSSFATDIVWLKLNSVLSYRDLSLYCSTEQYPRGIYFSAEVSGGKLVRAFLRTDIASVIGSSTELTADDLKNSEVEESSDGKTWLKRLHLGAKSLNWLLFNIGGNYMTACKPTQPLATMSPQTNDFDFDLSAVLSLPSSALSSTAKLNGQLKNKDGYRADLYFIQVQAH